MPAETNQHLDDLGPDDVLDLLLTLVGGGGDEAGADTPLVDLGVDDDLARLELWDAAAEEFGERSVGEVDIDVLREPATLGALAACIATQLRRAD